MTPQVIVENRSNANNVHIEKVVELLKILTVANMVREQQQVNILLEQMQRMEENQLSMMQELADVKQQLNTVMEKMEASSARKGVLSKVSEQVDRGLAAQHQHLQDMKPSVTTHPCSLISGEAVQDMKQDLNTKAGEVTQKFRDMGTKALNNVCGFLGVKEKMIAMRDKARSAEVDMQIAVEKITAVENEFSAAKAHLKTAGRITVGKEPDLGIKADEKADRRRLSPLNIMKKIYLKHQKKYADRVAKLDRAIKKVDLLEKRASVLDKLSDNKENLDSVKEEKDRTAPERSTEHKRDEIALY